MESERLIRCAQRLFITTSGTNNEAVSGRTWMLAFPSLSSAVKAKGPLPCHRASTRLPLGGPVLFADRGIKMLSASDAGVEKANVKATLWLPLHSTHVQHERLDI